MPSLSTSVIFQKKLFPPHIPSLLPPTTPIFKHHPSQQNPQPSHNTLIQPPYPLPPTPYHLPILPPLFSYLTLPFPVISPTYYPPISPPKSFFSLLNLPQFLILSHLSIHPITTNSTLFHSNLFSPLFEKIIPPNPPINTNKFFSTFANHPS